MKQLDKIPPSTSIPTCGRIVHIHYEWVPGQRGIEILPAIVIRGSVDPATGHHLANVVPFGDGCPDGIWYAPVSGVGEPLCGLFLFDPLDGLIPDVTAMRGDGVFGTRRVWAEWMPFQKGQASKTEIVVGELKAEIEQLRLAIADMVAKS